MRGKITNQYGEIQISKDVISQYAGSAAVECFGIVGMASVSMKDGLVRLLRKDSFHDGVTISLDNNELSIDFHVIVAYGVSISTVCTNLAATVRYKLEEFTGLSVKKITIYVEGVRVID